MVLKIFCLTIRYISIQIKKIKRSLLSERLSTLFKFTLKNNLLQFDYKKDTYPTL